MVVSAENETVKRLKYKDRTMVYRWFDASPKRGRGHDLGYYIFSFLKLVLELLRYLLNYQLYTLFHAHPHALYGLRWWGTVLYYSVVEGGICLPSSRLPVSYYVTRVGLFHVPTGILGYPTLLAACQHVLLS